MKRNRSPHAGNRVSRGIEHLHDDTPRVLRTGVDFETLARKLQRDGGESPPFGRGVDGNEAIQLPGDEADGTGIAVLASRRFPILGEGLGVEDWSPVSVVGAAVVESDFVSHAKSPGSSDETAAIPPAGLAEFDNGSPEGTLPLAKIPRNGKLNLHRAFLVSVTGIVIDGENPGKGNGAALVSIRTDAVKLRPDESRVVGTIKQGAGG